MWMLLRDWLENEEKNKAKVNKDRFSNIMGTEAFKVWSWWGQHQAPY